MNDDMMRIELSYQNPRKKNISNKKILNKNRFEIHFPAGFRTLLKY